MGSFQWDSWIALQIGWVDDYNKDKQKFRAWKEDTGAKNGYSVRSFVVKNQAGVDGEKPNAEQNWRTLKIKCEIICNWRDKHFKSEPI